MFKKNNLLKSNAIIVLLAVLSPLVVSPFVMAEPEESEPETVTATVTVTNVSIQVSDGSIEYGTLSANSSANTLDPVQTQTVTNLGNVPIDILVRGQHSANWTLGSEDPGENVYTHSTCVENCASDPSWANMTTTNGTILNNVAASATPTIDFQIETPVTTTFFNQQSVDVTVMGVEN